ncbi:MAG TPA: hypothetical protein VLF89_01115 [Candidatus Saccharimonadales bacterium]|nr:hypothetical protein [Candidatus Saccharimonadales bacterium]
MKKIVGSIITLVIGGTVFSFSQADVVKNFSKNSGLTQQEAQQYVDGLKKEDLQSFDKIGSEMISDGQQVVEASDKIDCVNYTYKWVSDSLSCEEGKAQLYTDGNDEIALGNAYKELDTKKATKEDMSLVISDIDTFNSDLESGVVSEILGPSTIDEMKKSNNYNKALLQSALDSKR